MFLGICFIDGKGWIGPLQATHESLSRALFGCSEPATTESFFAALQHIRESLHSSCIADLETHTGQGGMVSECLETFFRTWHWKSLPSGLVEETIHILAEREE